MQPTMLPYRRIQPIMLGEAKPLISGLGYAQRSESGDGVFVKAAVRGMSPPHQLGGLASAASLLGV